MEECKKLKSYNDITDSIYTKMTWSISNFNIIRNNKNDKINNYYIKLSCKYFNKISEYVYRIIYIKALKIVNSHITKINDKKSIQYKLDNFINYLYNNVSSVFELYTYSNTNTFPIMHIINLIATKIYNDLSFQISYSSNLELDECINQLNDTFEKFIYPNILQSVLYLNSSANAIQSSLKE